VQIYVSLNGDVVADTGVGESQPGVSMTSETINLWLSAGKPLTAFAIARLKAQGRLDYDDPLGTHLPEWNSAGQPAVTLRQLLTHQAGFSNCELRWPELGWNRILQQIVELPIPKGNASSRRAGYVVAATWFLLGEVVVRCTNFPFEKAIKTLILEPLRLTSTFNGISPEGFERVSDRLGRMYEMPRNTKPIDLQWHLPNRVCAASPGGNTHGPIRELGRFYEMLLAAGCIDGRQILSAEEVHHLTARHRIGLFDDTFQHRIDWGLGFIVNSNRYGPNTVPYGFGRFASEATFGHGGSESSMSFADPERQLVVAWVANGRPGEPRHQRRNRAINEAIYQDLKLTE
ncbi:MAG TPA: serine hydrolase domain-containing protein, partial [Planctomycetaceae bacterium]|nr:serine hydrolase domain-containing protein [Planctomycetaceae bacterium]